MFMELTPAEEKALVRYTSPGHCLACTVQRKHTTPGRPQNQSFIPWESAVLRSSWGVTGQ